MEVAQPPIYQQPGGFGTTRKLEDSTNVKYSSNVLQSRQDNLLQRAGFPDICELADSPSQRYPMLCWGPVPLTPARNPLQT